jgi:hypothetical protein
VTLQTETKTMTYIDSTTIIERIFIQSLDFATIKD